MAQQFSGSPEADDQLPSRMQSTHQSKQTDSTSQAPTTRKDTRASTSSGGSHNEKHDSHDSAPRRTYTKSKDTPSRPGGVSTSSTASLEVPRPSSERGFSRSMTRSSSFEYRETLNAKSEDLDDGSRIINQYKMSDVIGQGAYGTVHKATLTDDPEVHFAIKEFGKTRLRKNNRYSKLRRPRGGSGGGSARGDAKAGNTEEDQDPLSLIRREIAILKKLHHPHVVKLFEVLDDPSKDSLYLVFDYCPDGTVIDIKLNETVEPLAEDVARFYFVQILLGIEYLHENEVVHRDIKPDNILLADNGNMCKIVDFGVSEMFTKPGDDTMEKSAGSPAFMSPELCTSGHRGYHGKSDDVWSFGITLYCMVVGHLPFNKDNFYALYEAIKNDEPEYPDKLSGNLKDLLQKMLAKDPKERITIPQMREHPWVTEAEYGTLVSKEDNLQAVVSDVTEEELNCAICKITNIFTFARAVSRFKKGGSMARAKREASSALSGGSQSSDRDKSWFPSIGSSAVHSLTAEPDDADSQRRDPIGTVTETDEQEQSSQPSVVDAAKDMFKSSLAQVTTLAPQEADKTGPLQRIKTAPASSLHPDLSDEPSNHQTEDNSPGADSPEMVSSPISEHAQQGDASQIEHKSAQDEESASHSRHANSNRSETQADGDHGDRLHGMISKFSTMVIEHRDGHPGHQRGGVIDQRTASTNSGPDPESRDTECTTSSSPRSRLCESEQAERDHDQPKLLPDQETVTSPHTEALETPPGASLAYVQGVHRHPSKDSYFQEADSAQEDNKQLEAQTDMGAQQ